MAGRAVSMWSASDTIREFGGHFRAQVWPGDSLYAYTQGLGDARPGTRRIEILTLNQNWQRVFIAHAISVK